MGFGKFSHFYSAILQLKKREGHNLSLSLSLRANKKGSFGPVSVHAWYGSSAKVVMAIWKMSRDQHMFYRSKRASRVRHFLFLHLMRI